MNLQASTRTGESPTPTKRGWVLVVGATSDITRCVARRIGALGYNLLLAARDAEQLEIEAADLRVRCGVAVYTMSFDAVVDEPSAWMAAMRQELPRDDTLVGMVVGLGLFARESMVKQQPELAQRMDRVNHRVPVALTEAALGVIPSTGFVCVIGSVAGDRVRANLASYGQSKRALDQALARMRSARPGGPQIITAKPGPTDTAMTWGLEASGPLAQPDEVAACIVRAIERRQSIVYCPGRWRWIMAVIRALPGPLFRWLLANR